MTVRLFPDDVPAFLRSVYDGLAFVTTRRFPPSRHLVVSLPGDRTYKAYIPMLGLSPWLSSGVR